MQISRLLESSAEDEEARLGFKVGLLEKELKKLVGKKSKVNGWDMLDGGRIHLYIPAQGQQGRSETDCAAFFSLPVAVQSMLLKLLESAERRCKDFLRSQRTPTGRKEEWSTGHYSLIFSFDGGRVQATHVDVPDGLWQFALNCCDNDEPTWIYLGNQLTAGDLGATFGDVKNISRSAVANRFATLLQPRHLLTGDSLGRAPHMKESGWKLGDVLALKGGWPHAGPEYTGFRCVLFMVGTPDSGCDPYNEDEQHTPWTVLETLSRDAVVFTGAERRTLQLRAVASCVEWQDFHPWARWETSAPKFSEAIKSAINSVQAVLPTFPTTT